MKLNNNALLIGGAAVVAGAYLVYKTSKANKSAMTTELDIIKKQVIDAQAKAKAAEINAAKIKVNSLENPTSTKSKIAVIQRSIGVNPDGIVGTQTLKQLKVQFPMLVNLTSANIERIYNYVKANPYTMPNATSVQLDYGKTLYTPLIVPNNNSGVNVFTETFKTFK
jgi:murein L,D-transpeptidase YcbB/YkuD